jgi:hypothetical protein
MTSNPVEYAANEERDAAFMSVGGLRAAVQAMESANPKDRAARDMWRSAQDLARKAMLKEWEAAAVMQPVEVPK